MNRLGISLSRKKNSVHDQCCNMNCFVEMVKVKTVVTQTPSNIHCQSVELLNAVPCFVFVVQLVKQ